MKLNTINEEWQEFIKQVHPKGNLPKRQYQSMKMAFYAGSLSTFNLVSNASAVANSEEEGSLFLDSIYKEIIAYFQQFKEINLKGN